MAAIDTAPGAAVLGVAAVVLLAAPPLGWSRAHAPLASAALGGLGMPAGRLLDPVHAMHHGAHQTAGHQTAGHQMAGHQMAAQRITTLLVSWSGALRLAGCLTGCLLADRRSRSFGAGVVHHGVGLDGMTLGMLAPALLASRGLFAPSWAAHPTMLVGMALGVAAGLAIADRPQPRVDPHLA